MRAFFEQFDVLLDAPQGIPQLRDLILQTAIQGKLVAQDPNDEAASVLLDRLENGDRTNTRSRKRQFLSEQTELPYEVPSSWQWTTLSQVGHEWGQKKPNVEFTYIDVAAIDNERGLITDAVKQLKPAEAPSRARKIVRPGTLIYSTVRPYLLNIGIVEREYSPEPIASTAFAIIHPYQGINAKYLFHYLRSRIFTDFVERKMQGVAYPAINDEKLFSAPLPLPPSKEQERIVAKVDELMQLCDELEEHQKRKRKSLLRLNNAILAPLNRAAMLEPLELKQAVVRLKINFNTLYDSIETVAGLRSTILQLAVQGKLGTQNPTDEPAVALLDKISQQNQTHDTRKKQIKGKNLVMNGRPLPFALPSKWEWTRLGRLTELVEYGTSEKASLDEHGVPVFRMNNIVSGEVLQTNLKYVPPSIKDLPRLYLKTNDLLFNRTNSFELVGKTGIFKCESDKFTFASYLIRIRLFNSFVSPEYVNLAMNADYFRVTQINTEVTQQCGQANFNGTKLANTLIPLPPLEEQNRIVAKVNQLMSLCDDLEAKLEQAETNSEKLMSAAAQHVLTTISHESALKTDHAQPESL